MTLKLTTDYAQLSHACLAPAGIGVCNFRVRRMHMESVVNSQEEPVSSLLGKPCAPVHKIIEGILVPVIIICQ